VIQIDKLTNAGERYFFKMLMTADTNTAFGEEVVMLDAREGNVITTSNTTITMKSQDDAIELTPVSDQTYTIEAAAVHAGARLSVSNKSAEHKATVQGTEVAPGKTVSLYYDGRSWFEGDVKEITLSSDLAGQESKAAVSAPAETDSETEEIEP